jgi:vancomycin aglycone glucosyltransferase
MLWATLAAVVSQGWADLAPGDSGKDCLSVGDVNFEKLFPRVAAIVHHGGAGTTTAAARAGRAQVIIPHFYDQFYWAHRVHQLGVGVSGPTRDDLTVDALVQALRACLRPEVTCRLRRWRVASSCMGRASPPNGWLNWGARRPELFKEQ